MSLPGPRRCVLFGGAGAVGTLLAEALWQDGTDLTIVDTAIGSTERRSSRPRWHRLRGDATVTSTEAVGALWDADLVVLALPEPVIRSALPVVSAAMSPGALLVDTSSVKSGVADCAPPDRQFVSLNPMFAPALGIPGRPVAAVVLRNGDQVEPMLETLRRWGARVITMTAAEHDRVVAASQAMTHAAILAFGVALESLDLPLSVLATTAPPPHQSMLALLSRLLTNHPDVYWDVQAANPYAKPARVALADGLRHVARLVDEPDPDGFGQLFDRIRSLFGADLDEHQHRCAEIFAGLAEHARTRVGASARAPDDAEPSVGAEGLEPVAAVTGRGGHRLNT